MEVNILFLGKFYEIFKVMSEGIKNQFNIVLLYNQYKNKDF